MSEIKQKLWNGRRVKEEKEFNVEGTFQSYYAALSYLTENGYSHGSMSAGRRWEKPGSPPIPIQKGEYDLPEKWHNLSKENKQLLDGIVISSDWREGLVKVILFEDKKVL